MQKLMQQRPYTGRLQRLLALVSEIKTNPRQQPRALYQALGISSSMFGKDRQVLAGLGFAFRYDRGQGQYVITHDEFLPVLNLSTSEMVALIMAVRQLSSTGDYTLTFDAIEAIRKILSNTPAEIRAFLQASLDDVVLKEGFGCRPAILDDLWRACVALRLRRRSVSSSPAAGLRGVRQHGPDARAW